VNVGSPQWPQVSPRNRVHVFRVQSLVSLDDHGRVHFEDLEKDGDMWLEDVVSELVDDELFVPLARVMTSDPHVEEPRC